MKLYKVPWVGNWKLARSRGEGDHRNTGKVSRSSGWGGKEEEDKARIIWKEGTEGGSRAGEYFCEPSPSSEGPPASWERLPSTFTAPHFKADSAVGFFLIQVAEICIGDLSLPDDVRSFNATTGNFCFYNLDNYMLQSLHLLPGDFSQAFQSWQCQG